MNQQQPQQPKTEMEVRLDAMFAALQQQRDAAQVQVGQMAGEIAVLKMQLEEMKAQLGEVETQLEEALKPKEPTQD